jgi:HD-GYP domain-containing protein (c-di-GMP phosphodiesterase class II)
MGFLHDVGKIIVPAEILTKPSKLNDYESMFIKAHAQAGHDILKDIEFPWPVASAVLQHHERLNGSGYPSGLSGEQIIVEAKILAVADVVESMSSHRPYRPALGIDAAMEEIAAKQGILYDPAVAAALMEVIGYSQLGSAERTEACRFVI